MKENDANWNQSRWEQPRRAYLFRSFAHNHTKESKRLWGTITNPNQTKPNQTKPNQTKPSRPTTVVKCDAV